MGNRMKKFLIGILVSVIILTGIAGTGLIIVGRPLQGILQGGAYVIASDAPTLDKRMGKIFHTFYGNRVAVCDGTDDQVEFQLAYAALPSTGGRLLMSSGTFTFSDWFVPSLSRFKLEGQGQSSIIKAGTNLNKALISSNITTAVKYQMSFANFMIDGNKANQSTQGYGINMTGWNDTRVNHVKIWNVKTDGIYADGSSNTTVLMSIMDCTISLCGDDGIQLNSVYTFLIADNPYIGSNTGNGIELSSGGEGSISNNVIDQNTSRGIYAYGTDRLLIANNPYIGDNGRCGIDIEAAAYDVVIEGNMILENGSAATPYGIQVSATSRRVSIFNNWIQDNGSGDQDYAIRLLSGANQTMIHDNDLRGNVVAAILDSGAVNESIQSNMGWITELEGSSSIASGGTTKVVTHGLSATPTYVWISFKEQGTSDYGRWWVSSVNTTSFTLNVSADPGASNLDFYWRCLVR